MLRQITMHDSFGVEEVSQPNIKALSDHRASFDQNISIGHD